MYKRLASCILAICFGLSIYLPGFLQPVSVANAAAAKAYIVVQFSPQNTIVREVSFNTPSVTGMEALSLSGLKVETKSSAFGEYVCKIEDVGDCTGSSSQYWAYQYWDTSASPMQWTDYMVGASSSTVVNGSIEGWGYGDFGTVHLPPAPRMTAAKEALDWLQLKQDSATGGYGSAGSSAEALLSIGSNQLSAIDWKRESTTPSLNSYWVANGAAYSDNGADSAGKLATGLTAARGCWLNGFTQPEAFYNSASGVYADGAGPQSWAILGSIALGDTVPAEAVQNLKYLVQSNHAWEWQSGFGTDTNTTALVIQALIASGEAADSTIIKDALDFLRTSQNLTDGGFTYSLDYGTSSDANSTAYVVMAILASGQDPSTWTVSGGTADPFTYLLSLQNSDGGIEWQEGSGSNVLATQQTITALLGKYYPVAGGRLSQCPVKFFPLVNK
jgi:hypothetical protein